NCLQNFVVADSIQEPASRQAHKSREEQNAQPSNSYKTRSKNPRPEVSDYQPSTFAKTSGATIVASDSMMYLGVSTLSLPHVIFSLGTAPEYEPKLVVESLIWQK